MSIPEAKWEIVYAMHNFGEFCATAALINHEIDKFANDGSIPFDRRVLAAQRMRALSTRLARQARAMAYAVEAVGEKT